MGRLSWGIEVNGAESSNKMIMISFSNKKNIVIGVYGSIDLFWCFFIMILMIPLIDDIKLWMRDVDVVEKLLDLLGGIVYDIR